MDEQDKKNRWSLGAGAAPTIYENGGLDTATTSRGAKTIRNQLSTPPMSDYDVMKLQEGTAMARAGAAYNDADWSMRNGASQTGGVGDIKGAAARIQGGAGQPQRGVSVYNTYDIDRPASMGNPANDPWRDMARQLENFSKLRTMDPQPSYAPAMALPIKTQDELDNDEKTRRWAIEDMRNVSPREKARLLRDLQKDETDRRGQDMMAVTAGNRDYLSARGQDMDANTRMSVAGLQGRNQMDIENLRGQRQLDAYGLQGQNQLANTMLGYELAGRNQMGLERFKQEYQERDPYRQAQIGESKARAELMGVQRDGFVQANESSKGIDGYLNQRHKQYADRAKEVGWNDAEYNKFMGDAKNEYLYKQYLRETQGKAEGGLVGYADGGQVQMTEGERLMAEMAKKYGAPTGTTAPPQPVQAPAPAPQQRPPETWAEKARRLATGGLDQRMKGFAGGGPINVDGRQVVGAGTGKSDSLPAMIDGEQPAALSTGEFVMPVEAVQFFGLDRLNKMVAQSRKGLDTGRGEA